jgi:phage terminase large subunit
MLTSGNGFGKTTVLIIDILWTHLKKHPYRDCSLVKHSWVIVNGYDKVEDYWNEIKKWCPPSQLPVVDKMGTSNIRRLRWQNGDTTTFYSLDTDPNRFEGTNYHKLYIDEPPTRAVYIAALRGLRSSPDWSVVLAMTAWQAEPWLYEDLYLPGIMKKNPEIEVFTGSSYDNPHANKEFLDSWSAQMTEDERRCRIDGEFSLVQGRVFKEFNRKTHIIAYQDWPEDWPVYEGIDVHTRKPNTCIWLGVTKEEELVVIDECAVEGIEDFAAEILRRRGKKRIVNTCADNSALSQDWSTRTAIQLLRDHGVTCSPVRKQDKDVANGINKIKRHFRGQKAADGSLKPTLFVMENCSGMVRDLELYSWEDNRHPEKMGIKEAPRKVYDDFIDPLRYLVNRNPRYNFQLAPIGYAHRPTYSRSFNSNPSGDGTF